MDLDLTVSKTRSRETKERRETRNGAEAKKLDRTQ